MSRRPTVADIAHAAGLGVATVDRVLHCRPNVSARARQAVADAAVRLGYPLPAGLAPDAGPERPEIDLGFVLHKQGQAFYQSFAKAIEAACAARAEVRIRPRIRFAASQAPDDFVREIEAVARQSRAVAATAVTHRDLSRLTDRLRERGVPVFSMLNDFAGAAGAGYFGLDNIRVGRIAGWMMATRLQRPSRVAIFVGGTRWHGHGMRETGFRTCLRELAPQIAVLDTAVNLETRQLTYEATLDLLSRIPDLAGLYVAGGGMEGAIAALREARPADRVTLIVNELTPDSARALADRYVTLVIATPLERLCTELVAAMVAHALDPERRHPPPPVLEPLLYLPDSV